jgi:hypothetical protein
VYTHCVQPRPNEFDRSAPHTHTSLHVYVRTYLRKFERMVHPHTHAPARVRSNVLMYVRTYSVLGQREQLLGHISPPPSPIFQQPYKHPETPPPSLSSLNPKTTHTHLRQPPSPPPKHHRRPFSTTHTHRRPPKSPLFPIFSHKTRNPISPKNPPFFFYFLFNQRAQIHSWIVPLDFVLVFLLIAGGWN